MDICKVCGRKNPIEEANFCFYCGTSFREGDEPENIEAKVSLKSENPAEGQPERPVTSKWKWLLFFGLLLFPPVGWIAFLVITLVNAFGQRSDARIREMAKGALLFLILFLALSVAAELYLQAHPELMTEYEKMYQELLNGVKQGIIRKMR